MLLAIYAVDITKCEQLVLWFMMTYDDAIERMDSRLSPEVCLVGLHCCGDLSDAVLKAFTSHTHTSLKVAILLAFCANWPAILTFRAWCCLAVATIRPSMLSGSRSVRKWHCYYNHTRIWKGVGVALYPNMDCALQLKKHVTGSYSRPSHQHPIIQVDPHINTPLSFW